MLVNRSRDLARLAFAVGTAFAVQLLVLWLGLPVSLLLSFGAALTGVTTLWSG
jgi:hypothetical protein